MEDFTYAHNDTSRGERTTVTSAFNRVCLGGKLKEMRESAFARSVPTADDETLCFIRTYLASAQPSNILELGTAIGISGAVMLEICPNAHLTTVERDENFYGEAVGNFSALGLSGRVTAVLGDAGETIMKLSGGYDFILLDCAKAQYIKYLPRLKSLLVKGGALLADDVLLYGWITGETEIPKKRRMLAQHVREYVDAVVEDGELMTTVLNIGDGIALSVKR